MAFTDESAREFARLTRRAPKFKNKSAAGFHSQKERERFGHLCVLQRAGAIQRLRRQVRFRLVPKQPGERPVDYVADFVYWQDGKRVVEDCKGYRTPEYVIKRKLMLYLKKIRIRET
jgi:hypothetical protein